MQTKENMQDFVITMLKEQIPASYTYHNYEHTLYVQGKAREIGLHEHLGKRDMDLLNTAALWHDTGYIHTYKGHEEESCVMAKEYLPGYSYNEADIEIICGMMMATKVPQQPHSFLEDIIADADLAYLGTIGAAEQSDKLFNELRSIHPAFTKVEWNNQQIAFLKAHQFFTAFYRQKKEPVKQVYLAQIKKLMEAGK